MLVEGWAKAQPSAISFEQLDSAVTAHPRPTLVFIHTNWCRYCQSMKNTTLQRDEVIKEINSNFYFISFNAEQQEPVTFRGRRFTFIPSGQETGEHELARILGAIDGELIYPTIVLLDSSFQIIYQQAGYMGRKELLSLLQEAKK